MSRILLIEDDVHVVNFIRKGLREEGYEVDVASDGSGGFTMAVEKPYDLIILDIMLPDLNGLEVCGQMRGSGLATPILFLTALGTAENIAMGLNSGADDYIVKPFKFIELSARVKALLRRPTGPLRAQSLHNTYSAGDLILNDDTKTVTRNGVTIGLTATEYRLLITLMRNKGRVLSRAALLESVWENGSGAVTNVVDVYINYLRKKIDANHVDKLIHTVVGMGYVLRDP
jgi:two-component system, OmpR family, copper resistance phosphate regulon response regulator CusR